MTQFELILLAVGLSLDAFSVAICKGLGMAKINWLTALEIALAFGIFQGGMPLIGWALGSQFLWLIEPVDHWIAFIGGGMIREALTDDEAIERGSVDRVPLRELLVLAVATSIDALTSGIALASLAVDIVYAAVLICLITFALSLAGVLIGCRFGAANHKAATIAGGVILILIGTKVLLEHLGILVL